MSISNRKDKVKHYYVTVSELLRNPDLSLLFPEHDTFLQYPLLDPSVNQIECKVTISYGKEVTIDGRLYFGAYNESDDDVDDEQDNVNQIVDLNSSTSKDSESEVFTITTTIKNGKVDGDWSYVQEDNDGNATYIVDGKFVNGKLCAMITSTQTTLDIQYSEYLQQSTSPATSLREIKMYYDSVDSMGDFEERLLLAQAVCQRISTH